MVTIDTITMGTLFLIGRILLGGYFLFNAFNHFKHLTGYTGYAHAKGVPHPKIAVITTGVMLAIGGASILLGFYIVLGMWLLVLFLIPTTLMMHKFWKVIDPMARNAEMVNFMKNFALIGALLMMSALFAIIG